MISLHRQASLSYVVIFCMFISALYLFNYGNREVLRLSNYLFMVPILLLLFDGYVFKLAFKIAVILILFYFIQVLTLPYADIKIILNQIGFLLAFLFLSTAVSRSNSDLNNKSFEIIWKVLRFLMIVIFIAYFLNFTKLESSYNHVYSGINSAIGVHKQYLGVILAWFCAAAFVKLEGKTRALVLITIFFLFMGVRAFIVGYFGFILYIYLMRSFTLRNSIYFSIFCGVCLLVMYKPVVFDILLFDIRGIMLDASLNIAHSNLLGVGVGGVDEYLGSEYTLNPKLYLDVIGADTNYSKIDKDYNLVESDFMQLLIIIGPVLTGLYYIVVSEFIRRQFLVKWHTISDFKKYACISFSWFIFAGFFEDYMGNVFWWVSLVFLIGSVNEDEIVNSKCRSMPKKTS